MCEPGEEGEANTVNLKVTAEMSREEVVEKIRNTVREMEENQIKLQDGYYKAIDCWFQYWAVSKGGDELLCKDSYDMYTYDESVEYGDFGKSRRCIIMFILMYCRRGQ